MSRPPDPNMEIVREVWDQLATLGNGHVNIEEAVELSSQRIFVDINVAKRAQARTLVGRLDERLTRRPPPNQPRLFPDDDSYLVVGVNVRIREANALHQDMVHALDFQYQHVKAAEAQYAWEFEQFVALSPYVQQGMTKGDAIKAYAKDHPGQQYWIA